MSDLIAPHGSRQLNALYVSDDAERARIATEAEALPSIVVSSAAASNAVMLGAGYFNPLTGYMNKADTLYLDALGTMDAEKLQKAVRRLNAETFEDYWAVPLASRSEPWAARPGIVRDWRPVPLGPVYMRFETVTPGPDVQ